MLIPRCSGVSSLEIFYGVIDRVLRRLRKPLITEKLSAFEIVGLLFWSMLGLLVQSLAIWLILSVPLGLAAGQVVDGRGGLLPRVVRRIPGILGAGRAGRARVHFRLRDALRLAGRAARRS